MAVSTNAVNTTDFNDRFKERFVGRTHLQYLSGSKVFMRLKKSFSFQGLQENRAIKLSNGGSAALGNNVPETGSDDRDQMNIVVVEATSKAELKREAMKLGKTTEGAFSPVVEEEVKNAVDHMMHLLSVYLYGAGDGKLYTGNASNTNVAGDGTSGTPYVISTNGSGTSFNRFYFEEGSLVNINAETTELQISAVSPTSVSVIGTSTRLAALTGAGPFTTTDFIYNQQSAGIALEGLDILTQTSGSTYGISHTKRRWKGKDVAAAGAAIGPELLNKLISETEEECGKTPNLLIMNPIQLRKLMDVYEDLKTIEINARDKALAKFQVGFSSMAYSSPNGLIPIISDKYCQKDRVYAINEEYIEIVHAPDWGWHDEDGGMWMRRDASLQYQARYGGLLQIVINPFFHGVITGLSVA